MNINTVHRGKKERFNLSFSFLQENQDINSMIKHKKYERFNGKKIETLEKTLEKSILKQNKRLPNPRKPLVYWLFRRATDGARTRDLHLGKVAYYQLYYCRIFPLADVSQRRKL